MAAWEPLLDFEDIEHEMHLEDPRPSYEALVRWCGRYPQYRDEIAETFVDSAVLNIEAGEPQDLIIYDEDEIVMAQNLDSIGQRDYARKSSGGGHWKYLLARWTAWIRLIVRCSPRFTNFAAVAVAKTSPPG